MKRIDALTGKGSGRDLLIIGGGFSVESFEFAKLPISTDTMTLNDSLYFEDGFHLIYPTFLMYYDANMIRVLKKMKIPAQTKVIGYNNSYWEGIDYDYRLSDVHPSKMWDNLAVKAIVIAKKIMAYENIFLIGVDFNTRKVGEKLTSHYQGEAIGLGLKYSDEMHYKTHIENLDKRVEEFEKIKDIPNVWNCSMESKLKIFGHKLPY